MFLSSRIVPSFAWKSLSFQKKFVSYCKSYVTEWESAFLFLTNFKTHDEIVIYKWESEKRAHFSFQKLTDVSLNK